MKIKAILLGLTLSAVSVFGQGLVTFQNSAISTPIKLEDGTTLMPAGGGAYSFYFTYGATPGTLNNTSSTYLNHDTAAGRITTTGTANIPLSIPGGTPAFFQLYAFSTAAGSYANATTTAGSRYYQSPVITLTPSTSPSPGTPMFGTSVGIQFQGFNFNVASVPEPSTIALGVLGAGALLVRGLRRK